MPVCGYLASPYICIYISDIYISLSLIAAVVPWLGGKDGALQQSHE